MAVNHTLRFINLLNGDSFCILSCIISIFHSSYGSRIFDVLHGFCDHFYSYPKLNRGDNADSANKNDPPDEAWGCMCWRNALAVA